MPAFIVAGACLIHAPARAVETDQFLLWDRELSDSAEPLNRFFNEEIRTFLQERALSGIPPLSATSEGTDVGDCFDKCFFEIVAAGCITNTVRGVVHGDLALGNNDDFVA